MYEARMISVLLAMTKWMKATIVYKYIRYIVIWKEKFFLGTVFIKYSFYGNTSVVMEHAQTLIN